MVQLTVTLNHNGKRASAGRFDFTPGGRAWLRLHSGSTPTLGLNVFSAQCGDWIYGVLRFSNGVIGRDGKGFCGVVYADSLEVKIAGKPVVADFPRLKREAIVFRARACIEIPFYANARGLDAEVPPEVLRVMRSQIKPEYRAPGYGPTNSRQPSMSEAALRDQAIAYGNHYGAIQSVKRGQGGPWSAESANIAHNLKLLGPILVEGYPNGYAHGGFGIDPNHGWELVPEATAYHAELHRANMHRQFCDALDAETGLPIPDGAWTTPPGRDLLKGEPGRSSDVELVYFTEGSYEQRRYPRFNAPKAKPSYEDELWSYRANDLAHIPRVIRHTIPVVEYAQGTPMGLCAAFDLAMIAEDARYQAWSDRGDQLIKPSYPGEWVPQSLARMMYEMPPVGQGRGHTRLDRNAGWMAYLGACMVKYQGGKNGWNQWAANMLHVIQRNQDKHGLSHRDEGNGGVFTITVDGQTKLGRGTQTFHSAILGIGVFALELQASGFGGCPPWVESMARALYMTHEPIKYGYGTEYGPAHWGMSELEGREVDSIIWLGEGDPAHALAFMALVARGANREQWIDRSLKYYIQHPDRAARKAWLNAKTERSWTAEIHALMERG